MAGLKDLVNRAIADVSFRRKLSEDPASVITGYDLTDEQKSVFLHARGRDLMGLLAEMDLDSRVSKSAFGPKLGDDKDPTPPRGGNQN